MFMFTNLLFMLYCDCKDKNGTTDYGVTDTFVVTVSDSDFNREPGDVNGDGDVNIIDLIRAKKQVAGIIALTGISFDAADLDSNNVVNAVDLSLLRKMSLIIKS